MITWIRTAALMVAFTANALGASKGSFVLQATYPVSGEVAEIAAVTSDGKTLLYTDSESEEVGVVDISDPSNPIEVATIDTGAEPTSVAITPDGRYALVAVNSDSGELQVISLHTRKLVRTLTLGGQPDCVAVSPNGRYAAVAIENERPDEDATLPVAPAGWVVVIDLHGPVSRWIATEVSLTGVADRFSSDPEPEFVAINGDNIAAVTLQENNYVVLISLETATVVGGFSAGSSTHPADLTENGTASFTEILVNARREPDGIAWTRQGNLVTANEGDYDLDLGAGEYTGGRDFTVFSPDGSLLFESSASFELAAVDEGIYPDNRSADSGVEPEGVAVAKYRGRQLLFVGSERAHYVAVYDFSDESAPELLQILRTGQRPEGLLPIPNRSLFVTANEDDGTISIFKLVD